MIIVKNINPSLTPSKFGGDVNFSSSIPMHGTQTEMPLVFNGDVCPKKNGKDEMQVTPFFNQITYMGMVDMDRPCEGVSDSYAGMSENLYVQVKQPTIGSSIGGVSAVPQPMTNMRSKYIGLSHTPLDIGGMNMKLMPTVNSFDKKSLGGDFYT